MEQTVVESGSKDDFKFCGCHRSNHVYRTMPGCGTLDIDVRAVCRLSICLSDPDAVHSNIASPKRVLGSSMKRPEYVRTICFHKHCQWIGQGVSVHDLADSKRSRSHAQISSNCMHALPAMRIRPVFLSSILLYATASGRWQGASCRYRNPSSHYLSQIVSPIQILRTDQDDPDHKSCLSAGRRRMPPTATSTALSDNKEPLSEVFGETLNYAASTVGELLAASSTANANRTALVCLHQPATLFRELPGEDDAEHGSAACVRWSYAQLQSLADTLAASLSVRSIEAGAPIATLLPNGAQRVIIQWTAARLSYPLVPLDIRLLSSSSQVEHMLKLSRAKALLVWDSQMALVLARHMQEVIKQLDLKILALPGGVPGWHNFQDLASESQRDNIRSRTRGTDEAALIIFTSGTTALPKGCIQTHRNLMAGAEANRKINTMDAKSVVCGHMSLSHIAGNNYALACWAIGGTLVPLNRPQLFRRSASRNVRMYKCRQTGCISSFVILRWLLQTSGP